MFEHQVKLSILIKILKEKWKDILDILEYFGLLERKLFPPHCEGNYFIASGSTGLVGIGGLF